MVHHRLGLMPLTPRRGAWQDPFQKKKNFFFSAMHPDSGARDRYTGSASVAIVTGTLGYRVSPQTPRRGAW